jgi:hypothetical protein
MTIKEVSNPGGYLQSFHYMSSSHDLGLMHS